MSQKIVEGFFMFWRGWNAMFSIKGIWWLLLLPVLINLAIFAGFIMLFVTWIVPSVFGWFEFVVFGHVLAWIVAGLILAIYLILYAFLFSIVAEILGSPFYEEIGARIDRNNKVQMVERPWYKEFAMTVSQESQKLIALGLVTMLTFFLQFLPVVGQVVGVVLGFILLIVTLGADAVGPSLYRRGLTLKSRRKWVIKHVLSVIGMGLAKALGLVVPVLNIVVLPMAAAGGTLLVQKYDTK